MSNSDPTRPAVQGRSIVTDDQVAQYHRDGFLIVPGLYDAELMAQWKQHCAAELERSGGHDYRTTGVHVWMCDTLSPLLLTAMGDERVTPYLQKIIGPDIEFLSAKVVYKDAKATRASPWHQDWFYWEGATKISVWIALDDATPENGALKFVPGTHQKVYRKRVQSGADSFQNTVDEADFSSLPQVTIDVKRGDAVFFHDLAIHGSHPNTAGRDRWSLITTYRDGSVPDPSPVWTKSHVISGKRVNFGG